MVIRCPYPDISIPQVDLLTYIFGSGKSLPKEPVWINAADPRKHLSLHSGLQWIKRLAVGLDRLGVKQGEVVMIVTPNHIFVPIAYLGTVGSGRIFSGANPAYTADEISYQLQNTEAKAVLVHPALLNTTRRAARMSGLPEDRLYIFSDVEHKEMDGIRDWRSLLGSLEESEEYNWPRLSEKDSKRQIATVNFSSGTTGLPKGVMITHFNLIANVEQCLYLRTLKKQIQNTQERWVGFLPLFHAYGQLHAIIMAAKIPIPVYIMTTFVYEDLLQTIQTHKITELHVAPPVVVLLAKHPATPQYDTSSVTKISSGAAPLSRSLSHECSSRLKTDIRQGWGMTELTCAGTFLPGGFDDDTGSVGILCPNSEVKLVDENGIEVATGERGEILIRGPNVSPGYWKNEKATKETILEGGWLRTGDIAVTDERGWFWIVDRLKELIKVSGLQVAPAELEAVLLTHPSIADAGVIGTQDTFTAQEKPRAYVQLKERSPASMDSSAEDIQEWIKEKVAKHKWLTGGVVFVDQVPKSAAGKIQRKVLREWAKKDTGQAGKARL